jgi:hypothetical protein
MFNKKKESNFVQESNIIIECNFEKYPKHNFNKDMEIMQIRNSDQWHNLSTISPEIIARAKEYGRSELLFNKKIMYAIMKGKTPTISYNNFKSLSTKFLAQYIYHLIKEYLQDLVKDIKEFTFNFAIMDSSKESCIAFIHPRKNSKIEVKIRLSGALLVGRIYAPWIYTGNVDGQIIVKTILHELEHYKMNMTIQKELWLEEVIKKDFRKGNQNSKSILKTLKGSASFIYIALCNLHDEGIAILAEKQNSDYIIFDLNKIKYSLKQLIKVSEINDPLEAEDKFENDFRPTSDSGDYYLGFIMCFTIGLWIKKINERNLKYINIIKPKKEVIELKKLNSYLIEKKFVCLENLNHYDYMQTFSKLKGMNHKTFFNTYEKACKELGFKYPVKFINSKFIDNISNKANFNFWEYVV